MRPTRRVTRFVHLRVPGVPTVERMAEIHERYQAGSLNMDRVFHAIIDIDVDQPYQVAACYARKDMLAGPDVQDVATEADRLILKALPNSDPVVLVTSAQYVIGVEHRVGKRTILQHTDEREIKDHLNHSWFDSEMWSVHSNWRLKNWSWPRFALYDSDSSAGGKVWAWVFHFGPWWIVRHRYAL